MGSIASNIESINTTKSQLKEKLNYLFDFGLTSSSTFRSYATELLKMYNESPTTSEEVSDNTVAEGYTVLGYKTSYLKNTKELIKEGLTLLGTNPSNTFSTYPDLMDDVYNIFPKRTGESSSITLSPVRKGLIRSTIEGNTEQQTYSGKNLLDYNDFTTYGVKTITPSTLTINNNTGGTIAGISLYLTGLIEAGQYTITNYSASTGTVYLMQSSSDYSHLVTSSNHYTFTYDGTSFLRILSPNISSGDTKVFQLQLEKNASSTSYEKYVGGTASPNPDYPQEVKVVKGENLFKTDLQTLKTNNASGTWTDNSYTFNGITFTYNNDGTIQATGTSTNTSYMTLTSNFELNGTFTLSTGLGITGNYYARVLDRNNGYAIVMRTDSNSPTATLNTKTNVLIYVKSGLSNVNVVFKLMIEEGTSASTYLPYNTIGIKKQNKNLFDKTNITSGKYLMPNGTTVPDATWGYSNYIGVESNTTYYVSGLLNKTGWTPAYCFYDNNKTFISGFSNNNVIEYSFTTPANAKYVMISFRLVDIGTIQLETGTQATTYEEHKETIYPLTLEGDNLLSGKTLTLFSSNRYVCDNISYTTTGTIEVEPSTTYTLAISTGNITDGKVYMYDSTMTATGNKSQSNGVITFNTTATTKYIGFYATSGIAFTSGTEYARIEKGTTIFPNFLGKIGNYKDRIYRTSGKNLFDKDTNNYVKGYYLDINGAEASGTNWGVYYIPVQPNTAYSISNCQTNSGVHFCWYDSTKTFISRIGQKQDRENMVSPNNASFLGLSIVWNTTSSAYDNQIMLNEGSTAIPYEPYGTGEWYLHNEIGKVVLNGTENWMLENSNTRFGLYNLSTGARDGTNQICNMASICEKYATNKNTFYVGTDNIRIYNTANLTLADWKTLIGTTNMVCYYVLATPQEIKIEGTLEEQLENLWDMYAYEPITYLDGIGYLGPIINASALAKR